MRTVVRWYGVFVLDGERVVEERPFDRDALPDRIAAMLRGDWAAVDPILVDPGSGFSPPHRGGPPWAVRDDADAVLPGPDSYGLTGEDLRTAVAEAGRRLGRDALRSDDQEIVRLVEALDDLQRAAVLLEARIHDWHAIADFGGTDGGRPLDALRRSVDALGTARATLEAELVRIAGRRAPNMSRLIGADLAGRLIARARGLDRLARMPAGTIQVLGAERAFFRHLRGGGRMPKHGTLYLHPWVHRAPRKARGRAARTLAAKVAIAARADLYGGDLGDALVAAMEGRARDLRGTGGGP